MNLNNSFEQSVAEHPAEIALHYAGGDVPYKKLHEAVKNAQFCLRYYDFLDSRTFGGSFVLFALVVGVFLFGHSLYFPPLVIVFEVHAV